MAKLKVSLKEDNANAGNHRYHNEINAENFKEIATVLNDLANHNLPIDKAIRELKRKRNSGYDDILGI